MCHCLECSAKGKCAATIAMVRPGCFTGEATASVSGVGALVLNQLLILRIGRDLINPALHARVVVIVQLVEAEG